MDRRCGCVICPDCRPGKSCALCPGDCCVCRGLLPPGPMELNCGWTVPADVFGKQRHCGLIQDLLEACRQGDAETLGRLLSNGASAAAIIDGADREGRTPLYLACDAAHADVVKMLIEAGADVNKAGSYGCTPVYMASEGGHADVVKMLIEAGADLNKADDYGCTPVYKASERGDADVVKMLIEAGADVNKADNDGCTPVYRASEGGHTDVVKMLIEAGADVNKAVNRYGNTLFYHASV